MCSVFQRLVRFRCPPTSTVVFLWRNGACSVAIASSCTSHRLSSLLRSWSIWLPFMTLSISGLSSLLAMSPPSPLFRPLFLLLVELVVTLYFRTTRVSINVLWRSGMLRTNDCKSFQSKFPSGGNTWTQKSEWTRSLWSINWHFDEFWPKQWFIRDVSSGSKVPNQKLNSIRDVTSFYKATKSNALYPTPEVSSVFESIQNTAVFNRTWWNQQDCIPFCCTYGVSAYKTSSQPNWRPEWMR